MLAVLAGPAFGQPGVVPTTVAGGGLRMTVDAGWVDGGGYRPVRITLTPTVPPAADRTISLELTAKQLWGSNRDIARVVEEVEIPAGSGPVEATLSVPQMVWWRSFQVRAFEDGQLVRGLTAGASANLRNDVWQEKYPRVLVVGGKLPDSTALGHILGAEEYYQYGMTNLLAKGRLPLPSLIARQPAELPRKWIDYSSLDLVCLSLAQLRSLRAQRPEVFSAIRDWTAGGGNLLVSGVELDTSGLAGLKALLNLAKATDERSAGENGWAKPPSSAYGKRIRGGSSMCRDPFRPLGQGKNQPPAAFGNSTRAAKSPRPPRWRQSRTPPADPPFVFRPFGLGMVVAFAPGDPFDAPPVTWAWMLNSVGPDRFYWARRHGLSCYQPNPEFYNFLIPGVGLAPVGAFRVLITLFVLAIGPLNYLLLRRWHRLHLLMLTVPFSAGIVTLALFGYALVADGLGTRVRPRSFTLIDQQAGQAVCWTRLSYYAGLAPGRGLTFDRDVAVIPIEPVGPDRWPTREVVWNDRQRLTAGWLRPRTPAQYLTIRSRPSQLRLVVGAADADGLAIENRLGTHLEAVVVRDREGRRFAAGDVAPGAAVRATRSDVASVAQRARKLIQANEPAYPPGMKGRPIVRRSRIYRYVYASRNQRKVMMRTGCLERRIDLARKLLAGDAKGLPPRTYLAVVRRSPEVELGTSAARPEASLHVVIGSW